MERKVVPSNPEEKGYYMALERQVIRPAGISPRDVISRFRQGRLALLVRSQKRPSCFYRVTRQTCECEDFLRHGARCKHQHAVRFAVMGWAKEEKTSPRSRPGVKTIVWAGR